MAEAKKNKKEVKDETAKKTNPEKIINEEIVEKAAPKKLVKTAKAGKRSSKVQAEVIEKEAKEAKKAKASEEIINKVKQKPRVKKYSKNQKAARDLIEPTKLYTLKEALELLPKISKTTFDASAEIHVTLNIDPRQSDQIVRTTTSLPSGTGKSIKIAVIAQDEEAQLAKKAGADMVDADAIIKDISKEKINFDILIAAPDKMAELGKLAKVLGPKGLMPSPKNGTITADTAKATAEFKKGKVEIKNDANGVIHVAFGKVSFKTEDLYANVKAVVKALSISKPSGVKGVFIKNMFINSSMSPSIRIDQNEALKESK